MCITNFDTDYSLSIPQRRIERVIFNHPSCARLFLRVCSVRSFIVHMKHAERKGEVKVPHGTFNSLHICDDWRRSKSSKVNDLTHCLRVTFIVLMIFSNFKSILYVRV